MSVEYLRDPSCKSGFKHVMFCKSSRIRPFRAHFNTTKNGKRVDVYGSRRGTGEEAAQDADDHLRGIHKTRAPDSEARRGPSQSPLPPRPRPLDRDDKDDLGPESYWSPARTTEQRHLDEIIAMGWAGLPGEFATSTNGRTKILGDIAKEAVRVAARIRAGEKDARGCVRIATKVNPGRDPRTDVGLKLFADENGVDVIVEMLPSAVEAAK